MPTSKAAALQDRVAANFETDQVPFLERLVNAASCSREPEDVEAAAALIDAQAAELGLTVERVPDPSGVYADHRVYETARAKEGGPCLALVGHVDTVFPRSLGFLGFRREGDRAFGPGVLDMKSGLSSIFFALRATENLGNLPVRVIVNSDEEVGSPSSAGLFERLAPHTSAALVFEAGRAEDAIITARKGAGGFRVDATGRAAHSGLAHERGVNAIAALAIMIGRIEALTDYERGVTLNVGLIEGGTSTNTVPAQAHARLDARYERPEDRDAIGEALRAAVEEPLPGRLAAAELSLSGRFHRPAMVATDANRALLARYAEHALEAGLRAGEAPLQGGGSDANLLASHGIPCIDGLGPAGQGVHRIDEECSLSSLRSRTVALASFLADWARRPPFLGADAVD